MKSCYRGLQNELCIGVKLMYEAYDEPYSNDKSQTRVSGLSKTALTDWSWQTGHRRKLKSIHGSTWVSHNKAQELNDDRTRSQLTITYFLIAILLGNGRPHMGKSVKELS